MADVDLWDEIVEPALQGLSADLHVSLPGEVSEYSRTTLFCGVEWKSPVRVGPTKTKDESPGVEVPVITPAGDGYGVYFDLAVGDRVVGLVGDRPQTPYWKTGTAVPPLLAANHNLGNAVAIPGGRLAKDGPVNKPGVMHIGANDGSATIELERSRMAGNNTTPGSVRVTAVGLASEVLLEAARIALGANAVSPLLKGTELVAAIDATLAAGVNAVTPGDGGATAIAAMVTAWNSAKNGTLSTKGFVE